MSILLVAATAGEARHFLPEALPPELPFTLEGQNGMQVLITGIGMVSTAFALGRYFAGYKPSLAIHMGIAGTYDPHLAIGSAVEIVRDAFPEMGAESPEGFIPLEQLGFPAFRFADGKPGYNHFDNPHPSALPLPKVSGLTCNTVHGREDSIRILQQNFPAQVETMESAAFFQACLMAGVPFVSVRGISNRVETRDIRQWKIADAIAAVGNAVREVINTRR